MRKGIEPYKEKGEYIVYPNGTIFSKKRGKFISPVLGKGKSKYLRVKIPRPIKVHRLVAEFFVPNPHNKPHVNHKDGNKLNNNHWNLEWVTFEENMHHSHSTGLHNNKGENSGRAKLKAVDVMIIRECIQQNFNYTKVAKYFGVNACTISDIKSGKSWASL